MSKVIKITVIPTMDNFVVRDVVKENVAHFGEPVMKVGSILIDTDTDTSYVSCLYCVNDNEVTEESKNKARNTLIEYLIEYLERKKEESINMYDTKIELLNNLKF